MFAVSRNDVIHRSMMLIGDLRRADLDTREY